MDDLRKLKQASGMTNQQIADTSGIPLGTVNRVMSGQTRNPTTDTATAIREALEGATAEAPQPEAPEQPTVDTCHTCPRDMPTRQEYAQMSATYQDMFHRIEDDFRAALANRDKQFAAERAHYMHMIRAVAIACAVLVLFVMLLLVIDIANPNVGWVRAALLNGASDTSRATVFAGWLRM